MGRRALKLARALPGLVGYIRDQHHVIGYRSSRKRQRLAVPRNGEGERLVCFEESQLPGSAAVDWLTPEVGHSVPTLNKHYGAAIRAPGESIVVCRDVDDFNSLTCGKIDQAQLKRTQVLFSITASNQLPVGRNRGLAC